MKILLLLAASVAAFGQCGKPAFNPHTGQLACGGPYSVFSKVTSPAIGGSLLAVGTPATTTVTVAGATTGMACLASPTAGNVLLTGTMIDCYVSSANTVTLRLMGIAAVTPVSQTYDVRVLP